MKWFVRVYRRRSLSSALWLCALSIPLLVIYKTLTMFSLYQPLQSVYSKLCKMHASSLVVLDKLRAFFVALDTIRVVS